ncbi:MAG TPA: L-arabinonate dehydratase [Stellaceae bacterium]|nr:L-arabinonate dehydratase [Stellaceae bacterium]
MPASRRKSYAELRSARWYGASDLRSFGHRSRTKQMGFAAEDYAGKPVIAILNTWSEMNPCHQHFRTRAEEVKRGVWQAGGFPVEMPAMALGEPFMKPSTMMYRNLLAMEAEELLRANPIDGVVLMGGCDKTVPALVMGATSMNLPAIFLPAGPMLRGHWHGKQLGSGSDVWKYWAELRAGNIDAQDWGEIEDGIARSAGTCMTMGTASTMAAVTEALGLSLPGASSIPAADSSHARMATASGRRIVDMVWQDVTPRDIMTEAAFDNAIATLMAIGGSTNGIIHLVAMAGRAGIKLPLERFDQISRKTPLLANVRPSGQYLMEDFFYAGALPALLRQLGSLLDLNAMTVNGKSLGDNVARAEIFNDDVIRSPNRALQPEGGLAVLKGNLAPNGAVIKPSAMEPRLLKHRGPAVVFRDYNDLNRRIDDPALEVTPESVLVLQNAGPQGGPGMPEWGQLPIPKKLLAQGVRDMVRISDARMSGTSYGACVLHVSPESYIGGPLALVESGDMIELDVPGRRLTVAVADAELARRRDRWVAPTPRFQRSYGALYDKHIGQAETGCDFDFLAGNAPVPEPEIH